MFYWLFFFKQKTAYEMRISDWSSDVCSSDLGMQARLRDDLTRKAHLAALGGAVAKINHDLRGILSSALLVSDRLESSDDPEVRRAAPTLVAAIERATALCSQTLDYVGQAQPRSEEHTSELQSLLRISYAAFCLNKNKNRIH